MDGQDGQDWFWSFVFHPVHLVHRCEQGSMLNMDGQVGRIGFGLLCFILCILFIV